MSRSCLEGLRKTMKIFGQYGSTRQRFVPVKVAQPHRHSYLSRWFDLTLVRTGQGRSTQQRFVPVRIVQPDRYWNRSPPEQSPERRYGVILNMQLYLLKVGSIAIYASCALQSVIRYEICIPVMSLCLWRKIIGIWMMMIGFLDCGFLWMSSKSSIMRRKLECGYMHVN
jgi:hypothetical protein